MRPAKDAKSCVLVALSFDMARSVLEYHQLEIGSPPVCFLVGGNCFEEAGADLRSFWRLLNRANPFPRDILRASRPLRISLRIPFDEFKIAQPFCDCNIIF